ncbi:hypothetical protein GWK48_00220 [Metallosphaera tengchongensis]|uniref:Uncharacterized protein n=1 Tax=Metallosphaera tengchongensis TaxID=1532350 RepID=A0A6N0NSF9_9CREN|nr:hypothetical protein [Metallosphaera tengchongensis]QKQ99026.1 hypothetical protein GWK48_00220 [Metallosphaera tengchongensis]
MLYQIAFAVHMIGLIGWGGLTTGAYYVLQWGKSDDSRLLLAYRKLVYVEIASLVAMTVTGLFMWMELGFPSWVYPAFAMAPVLGVGELIHWRLTYVGDLAIFLRRMRYLSAFYTVIALLLIYDMVFKP